MERGIFITFEGPEGCGKSTQISALAERLEASGRLVHVTREPGGTPLGEEIRRLLQFAPEGETMTSETELLLFAASRAQLVREVIEPALAEGKIVIADRFLDSTTVYQGVARRLDAGAVERINRFAVGECLPEVTILLDMDSELAHRRALGATEAKGGVDRMESQPASFFVAVREGYLSLAQREADRICVIDAGQPVDAVKEAVWNTLQERIDGFSG